MNSIGSLWASMSQEAIISRKDGTANRGLRGTMERPEPRLLEKGEARFYHKKMVEFIEEVVDKRLETSGRTGGKQCVRSRPG